MNSKGTATQREGETKEGKSNDKERTVIHTEEKKTNGKAKGWESKGTETQRDINTKGRKSKGK